MVHVCELCQFSQKRTVTFIHIIPHGSVGLYYLVVKLEAVLNLSTNPLAPTGSCSSTQ